MTFTLSPVFFFSQENRFAQCDDCIIYRDALNKSNSKQEQQKILSMCDEHLELVM